MGSEFGINNMKAWIRDSGCWWCNGVRDIFLPPFGPVKHNLNAKAHLSIVADVHAFMSSV